MDGTADNKEEESWTKRVPWMAVFLGLGILFLFIAIAVNKCLFLQVNSGVFILSLDATKVGFGYSAIYYSIDSHNNLEKMKFNEFSTLTLVDYFLDGLVSDGMDILETTIDDISNALQVVARAPDVTIESNISDLDSSYAAEAQQIEDDAEQEIEDMIDGWVDGATSLFDDISDDFLGEFDTDSLTDDLDDETFEKYDDAVQTNGPLLNTLLIVIAIYLLVLAFVRVAKTMTENRCIDCLSCCFNCTIIPIWALIMVLAIVFQGGMVHSVSGEDEFEIDLSQIRDPLVDSVQDILDDTMSSVRSSLMDICGDDWANVETKIYTCLEENTSGCNDNASDATCNCCERLDDDNVNSACLWYSIGFDCVQYMGDVSDDLDVEVNEANPVPDLISENMTMQLITGASSVLLLISGLILFVFLIYVLCECCGCCGSKDATASA